MVLLKILYFGTVCEDRVFEDICLKSKVKPSAAPQNFEKLLIDGLDGILDLEVHANTFPPIPAYPNGFLLFWGRKQNKLTDNIITNWIPAINIQIIKQISYFIFSFFITLLWLFKNRKNKNKVILLYSIYMPIAYGTIFLAKIAKCKICVIVPDLPRFMFSYSKEKGLKAKLVPFFSYLTTIIESRFDGYILLTKFMNELINRNNKPYIVIEGLGNNDLFVENNRIYEKTTNKRSIMYAGTLNKKFGVENLIEAFQSIKDDTLELWLFGNGDMDQEILQYSQRDPRIKYFGRKPKNEILEYERKATLLVNIRSSKDEYTKYSFPSKTIEYMASGTPLLTTRLPGIPEEYYSYCYTIKEETIDGISESIRNVLKLSNEELKAMGENARRFIMTKKNNKVQARKIYVFLESIKDPKSSSYTNY